jgi:hypothetical protein
MPVRPKFAHQPNAHQIVAAARGKSSWIANSPVMKTIDPLQHMYLKQQFEMDPIAFAFTASSGEDPNEPDAHSFKKWPRRSRKCSTT